jgi:IS66 C-terminal element
MNRAPGARCRVVSGVSPKARPRRGACRALIATAKLNGVNPQAYLTDTLAKIAAGHPISRISELMPWAFQSPPSNPAA